MIICFDMDNTIIRAEPVHIKAFKKAFKKNKLKVPKTKDIRKYFGLIGKILVKNLFPNLNNQQINKIVKEHDQYVINETSKNVKVIRGAKGALKRLKKKGYTLALVSNSKHTEITAILKSAKIDLNLFSAIIGNEEVKKPKPDPEMINKALRMTKENKGYMVGDTIYDIEAGHKAGLKVIAVTTGQQTRKELKKAKPEYIIKSVKKINKILKSSIF